MKKKYAIVFTKSKKSIPIFSWIIRLWTWKKYSHVAIEVPIKTLDMPMYFQANEGKVNYEYKTHFDKEHKIVKKYYIDLVPSLETNLKIKQLQSCGENYGIFQNIGIALQDILKIVGINIKNPWKKGKNCSEIVYENILMPLYPYLTHDPNTIKPHHIEKILIEKGYKNEL